MEAYQIFNDLGNNHSSSPNPRSADYQNFSRLDKPNRSHTVFSEMNIKSVPSNHYLERRFKPYCKAQRQVSSVIKLFNKKTSNYFDKAKEDLKSFKHKSPPTDNNCRLSLFPEPITALDSFNPDSRLKEYNSHRSLKSDNKNTRESLLKEMSPNRRRLLIGQSISLKSKYCKSCGKDCKCIETITSKRILKSANHNRYRSLEFGLSVFKITDREKAKVIHSQELSLSSSPNKKNPRKLLVNLGLNLSEG